MHSLIEDTVIIKLELWYKSLNFLHALTTSPNNLSEILVLGACQKDKGFAKGKGFQLFFAFLSLYVTLSLSSWACKILFPWKGQIGRWIACPENLTIIEKSWHLLNWNSWPISKQKILSKIRKEVVSNALNTELPLDDVYVMSSPNNFLKRYLYHGDYRTTISHWCAGHGK